MEPPEPPPSISARVGPPEPSNSATSDRRATKRVRTSMPKVKSGCITCKTRRVKCDETRPRCLRCEKFGRVCDGYAVPGGLTRGPFPLQPMASSTSLFGGSISPHVTEDQYRYFQVYTDRAAHDLGGYSEDTFWYRLVPQASHSVTAIRYAAISLGALNQSMEVAPSSQRKVNTVQTFNKRHLEQAVLHYMKAIRSLKEYLSDTESPQLRNALIACMLFVCFEMIQGSYASSIQQQYGGLKLLRSYYEGRDTSQHSRVSLLPPAPKSKKKRSKGGIHESLASGNTVPSIGSQIEEHFDIAVVRQGFQTSLLAQETQLLRQTGPTNLNKVETDRRSDTSFSTDYSSPYLFQGAESGLPHIDLPHPQLVLPTADTELNLNSTDARRVSMISLHETSSAYSSDGSYRETPPLNPSINTIRKDSLSADISHAIPDNRPGPTTTSAEGKQPVPSIPRRLSHISPILQSSLNIEDTIVQSFARFNGPGLFFGLAPGVPIFVWDIHETWRRPIPTAFPSFAAAQKCWDFLMERCLQFYRNTLYNRAFEPRMQETDEVLRVQHDNYLAEITAFETAYQSILQSALAKDGVATNAPALILSLYIRCTKIVLSQTILPNEVVYDTFFTSFQYIIRICTLLVTSEAQDEIQKRRRFSFDVGIIPPLHLTATKCRDPWLRRQAVKLMASCQRQEGLWDSALSASIGRWFISCEEEGLNLPSFPEVEAESSADEGASENAQDICGDDSRSRLGAFECGESIYDLVNLAIGSVPTVDGAAQSLTPQESRLNSQSLPHRDRKRSKICLVSAAYKGEKGKDRYVGKEEGGSGEEGRAYMIPEQNRAQLTVVSFHIPDRYIRVKCQKTLPASDGLREEKETVINW